MDKESREFEMAVRALVKVPELDVRTYKDAESMSHVVSAELDSRVATTIADRAISRLGHAAGMGPMEFQEFLRFLREDPEMRDKFTAYKTAKRLMGE